jgi:hypothetical protein
VCCEYPNHTPRTSAVVFHIPVALSPCYRFCFSALHTSQTPASVSPVFLIAHLIKSSCFQANVATWYQIRTRIVTIWLVDQIIFVPFGSMSSSGDPCVSTSYVLIPGYNAAIPLELVQFPVVLCCRFRIGVPCQWKFSIEMPPGLSPLMSIWVRTAPDAYFDASDSIWKGFEWSGIINTGSCKNRPFRVSKASWHWSFQSNLASFRNKLFKERISSLNFLMNHL